MSETFFEELNIPKPDWTLSVAVEPKAEQAATIMVAFERELIANPADLLIVVGDVTSTILFSIRSFDLSVPEEINRMVTDRLILFYHYNLGWWKLAEGWCAGGYDFQSRKCYDWYITQKPISIY